MVRYISLTLGIIAVVLLAAFSPRYFSSEPELERSNASNPRTLGAGTLLRMGSWERTVQLRHGDVYRGTKVYGRGVVVYATSIPLAKRLVGTASWLSGVDSVTYKRADLSYDEVQTILASVANARPRLERQFDVRFATTNIVLGTDRLRAGIQPLNKREQIREQLEALTGLPVDVVEEKPMRKDVDLLLQH